jgi:hypothetical protein
LNPSKKKKTFAIKQKTQLLRGAGASKIHILLG